MLFRGKFSELRPRVFRDLISKVSPLKSKIGLRGFTFLPEDDNIFEALSFDIYKSNVYDILDSSDCDNSSFSNSCPRIVLKQRTRMNVK